ncbi:MAG TPA: methylated-DNA--[protein]-cysteine S-methyltransferase [Candidatus Dormibacteraeota bacterium]|nr:methylated-DNA--[protein]-cysteine S-methyltransferase [Candidatus Dormibacteraeota bacterium]
MNITEQLTRLGEVTAPPTLLPSVMAAIAGDRYGITEDEVWPLWIAWNRDGVSAVMRADENDEAAFRAWFESEIGRPLQRAEAVPAGLRRARRYDLSELTDFERDVLLKTAQIPRGEVRTYGWVAREIGRPAAVRAVGTALANNPIPVLIPCHRVVRSDGVIGNYGAGGTAAKKQILAAEGVDTVLLERLARERVRFYGSRTTHIFCLPTCHHARRVKPRNLLQFHTEREARAGGYRPCKVCRPVEAAEAV